MKWIYNLTAMFLFAIGITGCKTESENMKETTPPGQITDILFTPGSGGGYFTYTTPSDEDFLYARAEYTTDAGKRISKTSSVYSDTLYIEGLGTVKEYEIKLYSVDRNSNESAPVIQRITPKEPTVTEIANSLDIVGGFSSVLVTIKNPMEQPIDIYIDIKQGESNFLKVYSSNKKEERIFIKELEAKPYNITAYVKDNYQNTSSTKDFGTITPMEDYELPKEKFSFLRDQLLYGDKWDYDSIDWAKQTPLPEWKPLYTPDSLKNARESAFEGNIAKFWDNMTDENAELSLNYFHTGSQTYPFSYYIDLGRSVRVSRMRLWQRASNPYAGEQVKTCEIWINNDDNPADGILDNWEYVGTYTILKPSSAIEATRELKEGHEFWMYPDNPQFTKPFRYLRYKAIKQMGGGSSGCMSEITLYGTEVE